MHLFHRFPNLWRTASIGKTLATSDFNTCTKYANTKKKDEKTKKKQKIKQNAGFDRPYKEDK